MFWVEILLKILSNLTKKLVHNFTNYGQMLQAAKYCYKDFESQFSRIFKIAAGFQFYLHFPRGLQSAEGWPAEKISRLDWNVFGRKKQPQPQPRGKIE